MGYSVSKITLMFQGRGKYILTAIMPAVLLLNSTAQVSVVREYIFHPDRQKIEVISSGTEITINYNVSGLELRQVTVPEGNFYRVIIPGHDISSEKGKPELPVYSKLITIPGKEYAIRITDVKTSIIHPSRNSIRGMVYPRQEEGTKNQERQKIRFEIDRETYSQRGYLRSDTVKVEYLGKSRDKEIAQVSVFPVRYSPRDNELEVITSMKITISSAEKGDFTKSASTEALPFLQSFSKGLLNYTYEDLLNGYSEEPVKMVIITDTAFRKTLAPYMQWKTSKGIKITTLYKGAGLAGNTFTDLKDTLNKIYAREKLAGTPPVYLMIVGDNNRIPLSEGTGNISDLYYTTFDGTGDYLPEMFTGRISVSDTSELKAVLNKIIQYEKFQFADTNKFYSRTLATAGDDGGYATYMNGQIKYLSKYYLNPAGNISNNVFYYPQSVNARDSIIKLFNKGLGFVNYSGHGDSYGWLGPLFKSDDVTKLTNKNMYPLVISNACRTGQFNIPNSFGNTLLKSPDKGAIGFIGCSNDSYWTEDYYWAVGVGPVKEDPLYEETGLGAYDRMFHKNNEKASDWYISIGQINYAGNLAVSASTTTRKKYYWETYNVSGDPSIIPFIGLPSPVNMSLPDTLPNGIRSVTLNGEPYTYIAISRRDTLLDASYISPTGTVTLDLPDISNDSCLVVVTGQNKIPLVKTIYLRNIVNEYINLTRVTVNDIPGNNNGKADFGEMLYLNLTISNLGQTAAEELSVKISAPSPGGFTILNDSAFIGTLPGRQDVTTGTQLLIKIDDLIQNNSYVTLDIHLKDNKSEKLYKTDLRLYAPVLSLMNCTIDDAGNGNGDQIADPGESFNLLVNIKNSGGSSAEGYLHITDHSTGITIPSTTIATGQIKEGEITTVSVPATLSYLVKKGDLIEISATLDCTPYIESKDLSFNVGKTRESFEYQNFKLFPWNNTFANPWIITSGDAYDGAYSARSGYIGNNSESKLTLTINTPYPDSISFMYKVSSEKNYDFLIFRANGIQIFTASGETEWTQRYVRLNEGINVLEWIYRKDASVSGGYDCAWLDCLVFKPDCFNTVDIKTIKIISPETGKKLGLETITAEVANLGTDTLKQINMAFQVNNNQPVAESFNITLPPGDTTGLSFSAKADLTSNGNYIIKVFGINNNDGYTLNDTARAELINTAVIKISYDSESLLIMPNPFSQSFRVKFTHPSRENAIFTITNPAGKTIWESQYEIFPGNNEFVISPGDIAPGYYILMIRGKTEIKTARLIKTD